MNRKSCIDGEYMYNANGTVSKVIIKQVEKFATAPTTPTTPAPTTPAPTPTTPAPTTPAPTTPAPTTPAPTTPAPTTPAPTTATPPYCRDENPCLCNNYKDSSDTKVDVCKFMNSPLDGAKTLNKKQTWVQDKCNYTCRKCSIITKDDDKFHKDKLSTCTEDKNQSKGSSCIIL